MCTRINYKIVPVTNLNKYLHRGTVQVELNIVYINIGANKGSEKWWTKNTATSRQLIKACMVRTFIFTSASFYGVRTRRPQFRSSPVAFRYRQSRSCLMAIAELTAGGEWNKFSVQLWFAQVLCDFKDSTYDSLQRLRNTMLFREARNESLPSFSFYHYSGTNLSSQHPPQRVSPLHAEYCSW